MNNNDVMPPSQKKFNSYNQPSVNLDGLVVIRARSHGGPGDTGGGHVGEGEATTVGPAASDGGNGGIDTEHGNQPVHGIYTRDMRVANSPIVRILDRKTEVPQPNNLGTKFVETPSFPRIDMLSDTIATRGNHQPVWTYGSEGDETRAGTTGVYTNPFGDLITGAAKLGAVPGLGFFAVPGLQSLTMFDVFPGAPAVTGGSTIVFKGNFTVDNVGKTGVFYRNLVDSDINGGSGGGTNPVVLIANNIVTKIPGTTQVFGSTSPPSAANGRVVFAGFDDEEKPTLGGIYLAPLAQTPSLKTLVSIGGRVPGEGVKSTFNNLGEGGAFDGRFVGFWGAWGAKTRTVRLYCPTEGNKDRIDYCNQKLVCEDTGEIIGDENSTCDETGCWQEKKVPVNQGIFVHDTLGGTTRTVAKTKARFDEFLFWNYSGKTPCVGGGHSEEGAEDDGELTRWRSSAFVAVSGQATAFKAVASGGEQGACGSCHSGDGVGSVPPSPFHARLVGIYLNRHPGQDIITVLDTRTDGQKIDPEAPAGSKVTELGIERESLRGDWLVVNAKMGIEGGTEEEAMAGIYQTRVPK
ncbi:hypothetical protein GO003_005595 [Methylicorpusculum oleiharenae]|uniref:hypothetical protein n=1 Tax=Methylicorpusculum oleiharenae TaxID=1338687 RepID=UPI00135C99A6|nr:hypothetical protein [Methylicorpusculum oleiharenae]MCD2449856.1 hypothetical protein [Methylicorpusculum oleiharenae]